MLGESITRGNKVANVKKSDAKRMCRQRAVLEHERMLFGNLSEVTMDKEDA